MAQNPNKTQLERYKRLLELINGHFKEALTIQDIEEACFYSYRNINRIFLALQHETIGKYIKRLRLEKAAEYLKYTDHIISDIALEVGYSDIAAFSKAFKSKFNCSPSLFRESQIQYQHLIQAWQTEEISPKNISKLQFEVEELPDLGMLYLEYQGTYENIDAIRAMGDQLGKYVAKKNLLTKNTIFMAEILDDEQITESFRCRYRIGIILYEPLSFEPEGLFQVKLVKAQKYAKFLHKGSYESSYETYQRIYAQWFTDVQLEFVDRPTLEFFLNDERNTTPENLLTEIYIPIV